MEFNAEFPREVVNSLIVLSRFLLGTFIVVVTNAITPIIIIIIPKNEKGGNIYSYLSLVLFMFIGIPDVDNAYKEAINMDGEPLSRGHMNPSGINSFDINFMKATFTLTNAVPQFQASNSGPWQEFETRIRNYAQNTCGRNGGTLYLLTGRSENGLILDPKGNPVQDLLNTVPLTYLKDKFLGGTVKLETPRAVWTAGCCVWEEPGKVFGKLWPAKKAESFAVMSNNQMDKRMLFQTQMSVIELEKLLRAPLLEAVNLFPGNANCRSVGNNIANTPKI